MNGQHRAAPGGMALRGNLATSERLTRAERRMPRPALASVNAASLSSRPRTKPPSAPITPNPPPSPRVPPAPANSAVNTEGPASGLIRIPGATVQPDSIGHVAREDDGLRAVQSGSARAEPLTVQHRDADHADGHDDERDERLDETEAVLQVFGCGVH